jgi:hypothetical protein
MNVGLAPEPLMNRDPLIAEFTVIPSHRPSVVEANPFGGAAIVVSRVAFLIVFFRWQFDSFFPAVLEERTPPMSFIMPCPLFSPFFLSSLELVD